MANPLCESLWENYRAALAMLAQTIGQFDDAGWRQRFDVPGAGDGYQTPLRVAQHTVDCLDYYFRTDTATPYPWGHRFGGSAPSPEQMAGYLDEIQARIEAHFAGLSDAGLAAPYDAAAEHGRTRLGHYVYALRHTMHHHGVLSLLALQAGYPESGWE